MKREAVEECLKHGVTRIVLDARQPGVVVPDSLRRQELHLNVSYSYHPPDLDVSERGIGCTLSFDRVHHAVFVPWHALYMVVALKRPEAGMAWPLPDEPPVLTKRRGGLGLVS